MTECGFVDHRLPEISHRESPYEAMRAVFLKYLEKRFEADRLALLRNGYLTGRGGRNEDIKKFLEVYQFPWLLEALPEAAEFAGRLRDMLTPEKSQELEYT